MNTKWNSVTVRAILTNQTYIGIAIHNKKQLIGGKLVSVPEEDFDRVQEMIAENVIKHRATYGKNGFNQQIENGKARMEELKQFRNAVLEELDSMQTMTSTEEIADVELAEFSVLEAFDKDKLKALIDRVATMRIRLRLSGK